MVLSVVVPTLHSTVAFHSTQLYSSTTLHCTVLNSYWYMELLNMHLLFPIWCPQLINQHLQMIWVNIHFIYFSSNVKAKCWCNVEWLIFSSIGQNGTKIWPLWIACSTVNRKKYTSVIFGDWWVALERWWKAVGHDWLPENIRNM